MTVAATRKNVNETSCTRRITGTKRFADRSSCFTNAVFHLLMPRHNTHTQRLTRQFAELALAAPQVVMHRTARMATMGSSLSARDHAEFSRMGSEKVFAFYQSWASMWTAAAAAQFEFARACASAAMTFATQGPASAGAAAASLSGAATKVLAAGLAPVHSKAVANARRLARSRK